MAGSGNPAVAGLAGTVLGVRNGWWRATLVAIAVVPAAVLLLVESTSGPSTTRTRTTLALVGSVDLRTRPVTPGAIVLATVTVSADRPTRVDGLQVLIRDARGATSDGAGRAYGMPASGPIELGTRTRTVTSAQRLAVPGTYSYVLRYRTSGTWRTLPPYGTLTIR